jgi:hypothetical protein
MRRFFSFLALAVISTTTVSSHEKPAADVYVPLEILRAQTIAVAVYGPDAGWKDKAEVQAEGEGFLRHWKRYRVVRMTESPDIIALVNVEPVGRTGGYWRTLAYALAVGAQAFARSSQNYETCNGQINGDQVNATCYSHNSAPDTPPPPPPPNYVLSGSIMLFDGAFLRTGAPIPEPSLFANAGRRGYRPLIGAAKYLRATIEQGDRLLAGRMATVDALLAKVHQLAVAEHLSPADEAACNDKISRQIGSNKDTVARVERRDFTDVEKLFPEMCGVAAAQK